VNASSPSPTQDLVREVVREAAVVSAVAGEVIFRMPLSSVPQFAELFGRLKAAPPSLGIGSYGVSLTTLEQVCMCILSITHYIIPLL
jgi:hypothetical protein